MIDWFLSLPGRVSELPPDRIGNVLLCAVIVLGVALVASIKTWGK